MPSVVAVIEIRLHFSCPNMSDRLLYQSEAEQLMLERGLVVPFSRFLGASGIQGTKSRISKGNHNESSICAFDNDSLIISKR